MRVVDTSAWIKKFDQDFFFRGMSSNKSDRLFALAGALA
jgi:hypothetical protein